MGLCQLADVQSLCDQSPSLKNQINLDLTLMHHATAWFVNSQSDRTQTSKANVVEEQYCRRRSSYEHGTCKGWYCNPFFLSLTRWYFAQRHPSLFQSLRGTRSGGTCWQSLCSRMKLIAIQAMALQNVWVFAPTKVPLRDPYKLRFPSEAEFQTQHITWKCYRT